MQNYLLKIGDDTYPKIILFYNGNKIPYENSFSTENIDEFVERNIKQEDNSKVEVNNVKMKCRNLTTNNKSLNKRLN